MAEIPSLSTHIHKVCVKQKIQIQLKYMHKYKYQFKYKNLQNCTHTNNNNNDGTKVIMFAIKNHPYMQLKLNALNVFPPAFSRALIGWFNWCSHAEMRRRNQT